MQKENKKIKIRPRAGAVEAQNIRETYIIKKQPFNTHRFAKSLKSIFSPIT